MVSKLIFLCSDQKHVEWARSFPKLLEDLRKYVVQYHTTGVEWNAKVYLPHRSRIPLTMA